VHRPARRRDHPGDGGGARGVEDRLRRLDLDLEAEPRRRQAVRLLERVADLGHGLDLGHRGDLGERQHEAARQVARLEHPGEHELQRPQPPPPGRGLEALEADAGPGRAVVRPRRGRDRRRGRSGGLVLLVARPDPVAVLEVDAQVLDRLARELVAHPGEHLLGADAGRGGQVRGRRGVLVEQAQRRVTPLPVRPAGGAVGRHVDRVHGLARPRVAGVAGGQLGVGVGEALVEQVAQPVRHALRRRGPGHGHGLLPAGRRCAASR
jgi:hypothetical protein